jgi:hypothetical protein
MVGASMAATRPKTSMKRTLLIVGLFLVLMILVPISAWTFFDLEGSGASDLIGYMVLVGLAFGGWLGWSLLIRAFFGR